VEFGAHKEDGEFRGYGAGITGSLDELDVIFFDFQHKNRISK
jgi:hypothetical protein